MDVLKIFFEIVERNEQYLIELITEDQIFDRGIRGDNRPIRPEYARSTIKRYKKQRSTPNLSIKHKYLNSWRIRIQTNSVEIGSDYTVKGFDLARHLRDRYGEQIEKLTPENEDKFMQRIMPELIRRIDKHINDLLVV